MDEVVGMYELRVTLLGPERTVESNFGPRVERDSLANLAVELPGPRAWLIYQEALAKAVAPEAKVVVDDSLAGIR